MLSTTRCTLLSFALLLALLLACSDDTPDEQTNQQQGPPLQVLTVTADDTPESATLPVTHEIDMLRRFARSQGRELELVRLDRLDALIPALLEEKGDVAAANLTITPARKKRVAFTRPVAFVHEQIIARRGDNPEKAQDIAGRSVVVKASSSYAATLRKLKKRRFQPPFTIRQVDESLTPGQLLDGVAKERFDLTVLDSNSSAVLLAGRDDLHVAFTLGNVHPVAWAVRPDDRALQEKLNTFLSRQQLLSNPDAPHTGDLDRIKKRGVLRVVTRNNAATYYLWRGELLGFDYELVRRFADKQGLRLKIIVPEGRDQLLAMVRDGQADIAAASLTITPERRRNGITFSAPYNHATELLVTRNDDPVSSIAELAGRTVVVRRSSSYRNTIRKLQKQGIDVKLKAAPENLETERLIARVARGEYDLTVADSHIVDIEQTWRDDIRAAFALGEPRPHGWAMRQSNPQLKKAVDRYLKKSYRGLFYNVTYAKYFKNNKRILQHQEQRPARNPDSKLSPYDALVRRYARRYGIDWQLLLSQVYQESRFDPSATSWAGARGLMQVLPRTARQFGVDNLHDPESGLRAGVKYLTWLMQRFEPTLDIGERNWFALAAYNAGLGHVRDARELAEKQGLDRDRWFGNVEKAMLLLSRKRYFRHAHYGYVRGKEPVNYVRQIFDRYRAYSELTDPDRASSAKQ